MKISVPTAGGRSNSNPGRSPLKEFKLPNAPHWSKKFKGYPQPADKRTRQTGGKPVQTTFLNQKALTAKGKKRLLRIVCP